jgi:hypothetical protein
MAAGKNAAAGDHGAAYRLARFGRFGRLQWTADHGSALGSALSPAVAAMHASRAIGWPELSADAIWLTDKGT